MKAMTLLVRLSWYVAARNADDAGLLGNQGPEAWDIMGLLGKAEIISKNIWIGIDRLIPTHFSRFL